MNKLDKALEVTHRVLMVISEPLFMVLRGVHWFCGVVSRAKKGRG